MQRQNVESSNLHSVGWNDNVLEVAFKDFKTGNVRAVWQYLNVPKHVFDDLLTAPSVGKWFNEHVKSVFESHKAEG